MYVHSDLSVHPSATLCWCVCSSHLFREILSSKDCLGELVWGSSCRTGEQTWGGGGERGLGPEEWAASLGWELMLLGRRLQSGSCGLGLHCLDFSTNRYKWQGSRGQERGSFCIAQVWGMGEANFCRIIGMKAGRTRGRRGLLRLQRARVSAPGSQRSTRPWRPNEKGK